MKTVCWNCQGTGALINDCDTCEGTGILDEPRLEVMSRRRYFLGRADPRSDANGNEKWLRFVTEIPPEFAPEIDRIAKKVWGGHTSKPPSRAAIMRAALLDWMDKHDPESGGEHTDTTAVEIIERLEIAEASVVEEGGQ